MSVLDFAVLLGIGLLGMAMNELNWPRSAFALGFVLGPHLEGYFFLSYQIWGWSWLGQPTVLAILGIGALTVGRQSLAWYRRRGRRTALPPAVPDAAFAVAISVLALAVFATALGFPLEAGLFPALTAAILAAASLTVTARAILRVRRAPARMEAVVELPAGEWAASSGIGARGYAWILGLCALQAFLILAAGHIAGSFLFVAGSLLFFGRGRMPAALIAAGTSLVLAAVFDALVSQPWPRPWLAILSGRLLS
jgi:putative tricarboxylic transport membrane protein